METAVNSVQHKVKDKIHRQPAPSSVVERVCDEILSLVQNNSSVILLTGDKGRGKSSLLRKIGKKIAPNQRLIFFNGIDFLTEANQTINNKKTNSYALQNKNAQEFNLVKDFIYESLNLDENILILVDSADFLPADVLDDLIKITSQVTSKNNTVNLILAGLPKLKYQLDDDEKDYKQKLIHFSLDELNDQDIQEIASTKSYFNKPRKEAYKFNKNAINEIAKYIDGRQQLLDVILEWCSTLANEDNINTITKDIVSRAIESAEEVSNDTSTGIENAYPPSDKVEIDTLDEKQEIPLLKEEISSNDSSALDVDSEYPQALQKDSLVVNEALEIATNEFHEIENEIMPTKWVPAAKKVSSSNKPFIALASVIIVLVIGLGYLISYRLQPDAHNNNEVENLSAAIENDISKNQPEIASENEVIHLQDNDEVMLVKKLEHTDVDTLSEIDDASEDSFVINNQPETIVQEEGNEIEGVHQIESSKFVSAERTENTDSELSDLEPQTMQTDSIETAQIDQTKVVNREPQISELERAVETDAQQEADVQQSITPITKQDGISKDEINILLAKAEQQLAIKHLTTPYEDSAYKSYQTILKSEPDHQAANLGIQRIHTTYTNWANYYLRNNEIERSQHFFRKALEVNPNDQVSKRMLQNIDQQGRRTTTASIIDNQGLSQAEINQVEQVFIGDLLIRAKLQLQNKNLTTPPNNNAYETYQKVLRYQPDNHIAIAGITAIKQSYVNWAEQDLRDSNYRRSTFFYQKALAIDPSDAQLAQQLEKVKQLRSSELQN